MSRSDEIEGFQRSINHSSPFTKWRGHPAREYHGRLGRGNTDIRGKMSLKPMGETPMPRQEPHF
jgi:hypothetical protein